MKLNKKIKYTGLVILWFVSIACMYQTTLPLGVNIAGIILFLMFSGTLIAGIMAHDLPKKAFEWLNSND